MDAIWIIKADYVDGYELELQFKDGSSGVVDLKEHLDKPIFEPLRNVEFFKKLFDLAFDIQNELFFVRTKYQIRRLAAPNKNFGNEGLAENSLRGFNMVNLNSF